ncbi:uncharacterized protein ACRADG_005512 [Cochliomyia hominivorax]
MEANKSEPKIFLKCILPQCKGLKFNLIHKFPRNPQRCKAWLEAFDNPFLYRIPHIQLVQKNICCRHFRIADYVHPQSRKLNAVAVPSLNLKSLNELDKCRHSKVEKLYGFKDTEIKDSERDNSFNVSKSYEIKSNVSDVGNETNDDTLLSQVMDCDKTNAVNENVVSSSEQYNENSSTPTSVEFNENGIEIVVNEGNLQIIDPQLDSVINADILWLRHLCICDTCFDNRENKTLINFYDLDQNLQPVMATVIEETRKLEIIWSDGHTSTYNLNEVYGKLRGSPQPSSFSNYLAWNQQHTQYRDDLQPLNWLDIVQKSTGTFKALDRLKKSGVLIIQQIPKNDPDLLLKKLIITKLFQQSWNNFIKEKRKFFENHKQTIPYSNCTFESMDKGLQILTVTNATERIKLNLVDGFNAVQQIPKVSQDFFSHKSLFYTFKNDKGFNFKTKMSVILKNVPDLERVWFNPYHMDVLKSQEFRENTKHFKVLSDVMNLKSNQWQVEINDESIIILDNYRICWSLIGDKGNKELDCIYMERKHYLSSLSVLENGNMNA